ncbi:WhiB family transcriptional regulator [Micromonospora sp. CPCC 205371]|nr:WhiB family transcriptional regulator [Micromonospora sp. CPCC 205371]
MHDSPLTFFISGADVAWMDKANCSDTSEQVKRLFFADELAKRRGLPAEVPADADALCQACVARVECLAWALEHDEFGVWGGTTRQQREAMARPIVRAKCPACQGRMLFRAGRQQICGECGTSWEATRIHGDAKTAVPIPDPTPVRLAGWRPGLRWEQPPLLGFALALAQPAATKRNVRAVGRRTVRRHRRAWVGQLPLPGCAA